MRAWWPSAAPYHERMSFPLSEQAAERLIVLDNATSTNAVLVEAAGREHLSEFTVIATLDQRAGRGRMQRVWNTPPDTALAASVLFHVPAEHVDVLPWLPMIAGTALRAAIRELGGVAGVKWPNDVQIGERKVSGILSEIVSGGTQPLQVVVGIGVNLRQTEADFAAAGIDLSRVTSLALAGIDASADEVLAHLLHQLRSHWHRLLTGDASVFDEVRAACTTIGRNVRVLLPGDAELIGVATGIDAGGRILVRADGQTQALSVGDITHLRTLGS